MERGGRLLGRESEQQRVRALLAHARNRRGSALFLVGEPGIGKTALLGLPRPRTPRGCGCCGWTASRPSRPSRSPRVQRLTHPAAGPPPALPERHQQALRVAAGVADGPPPDRFLVGLGVLGLLAAAGEDTPVVCAVDDAHLLDSESLDALALVARRLEAESVALRASPAARQPHGSTQMAGVPALQLAGLAPERGDRPADVVPRPSPSTRRPPRRSPPRPAATRWP